MPLGSYPAVLGHEGAGVVRRLGKGLEGLDIGVGDRVLLSYSSCLNCSACKEGRKGACSSIATVNFVGTRGSEGENSAVNLPNGGRVRGTFFGQSSFSKLAIVDARSVIKYSGSVEELAFLAPLGCGFMTGAATVLNVLKPKPASSLAIFGLGAVGLSVLMAAKAERVQEILAIDIVESRLQTAASLGATKTIDGREHESVEAAIREVLPDGADYIVDTTGLASMIDQGVRALGHGGTLAIVGTPRPQEQLRIEALDMLTGCKTVIGVTGGYCDPQKVRSFTVVASPSDIHLFFSSLFLILLNSFDPGPSQLTAYARHTP